MRSILRAVTERRRCLYASVVLSLCGLLLPAAARAQDVSSKVEEDMQARVKKDRFSGSILIARDGKVLARAGYGMANLEHDVPNTPETKFRLGSITKQFTAMAILILKEQGKLCPQEKVKTYLPDSPKTWDEITVHHLLTHTSGIPNYTGFREFVKTMPLPTSLDDLVARFKDKPLDFKPGTKFAYSNSGYVLLGRIIEKVSGKSYSSFLKETIFEPLKMKDTGFDNAFPILKHRASGYTKLAFLMTNARPIDMSIPHAAGSLYSTVDDLFLWDRALTGETLVKKATLDAMFTPDKDGYAYGWSTGKAFGRKMVAHGGGINGFVTYIERLPEQNVCAIVLSNIEGEPVATIAQDLVAIALGEKYSIPGQRKAIAIDPKQFDAYAGKYVVDDPKLTFTITRDGEHLRAQLKGQPRLEIFPESETDFFYKAVEADITFVKDKEGNVTHLVLHQNGRDFEAKKQAPEKTPSPEKKP
jgi:CubicO group peptidase (beta-lactamase class C family)